ncbi:DUF305 domain-containing protein [Kitasatospora sp. NPDC101155]|uniref:DUF305 domain-containing protein n=1 Tax=Kitasatospora sp. NPDC101155 TaxID=3364097 RepID=UPI00380E5DBB
MTETTRALPRHTALATAVAAVLVLAACGSSHTSGAGPAPATAAALASVSPAPHNQADVTFTQNMILHHRQAIEMAQMAQTRASSSDVKALAAKIEKEQAPKIETMSGWLTSWGEKVPENMPSTACSGPSSMPGIAGPSCVPGMMDSQQMNQMMHASGHTFDTMFLTMMIQHHQGAIEMAQAEQAQGAYDPAKSLAAGIVTAQTAEIAQMQKMLGTG